MAAFLTKDLDEVHAPYLVHASAVSRWHRPPKVLRNSQSSEIPAKRGPGMCRSRSHVRVLLTIAVPIRKANKPQTSGPSRTRPVLVEPICATLTIADVVRCCTRSGGMLYDVVRDRDDAVRCCTRSSAQGTGRSNNHRDVKVGKEILHTLRPSSGPR
jgi:hypothetical protein